jgi:hypothetical protein
MAVDGDRQDLVHRVNEFGKYSPNLINVQVLGPYPPDAYVGRHRLCCNPRVQGQECIKATLLGDEWYVLGGAYLQVVAPLLSLWRLSRCAKVI